MLAPPPNDRLVTAPFLKVTGAASLYFLYLGITITVIPRLIEEHLGGDELDIGLSLAAFNLAAIAIRPGVARFGEQHHLRSMMVAGALLAGATTALSAIVSSRWAMLPLRGLQGVGQAGLFVGAATLINELAPSHRRAEAASYFSVAIFTGMGLGPVIGEAVVGDDRYALGLVIASLFSVLAAVASLGAPRNAIHRTARASGEPRFHRGALLPGTVMAFGVAGFATFAAFVPTYSKTVGVANAGLVFATYSAVCLLIRVAGAKFPERIGLARAVTVSLASSACGLFVLSAWPAPVGLYLGASLIAVGVSFLYPALLAMSVNRVPEHERVRLISTFTMFFEVGTAFGGLTFGAFAELTSKRGGFGAGAVSCVVGLAMLWRVLVPSIERHERTAPAAVPSATG